MTHNVARKMGIAGTMAGLLAIGAYAYAVALPYRLTPAQSLFLGVAFLVQLAGLALALGLGIPSLRGDKRTRGFAFIAITLGILALSLVLLTSYPHSVSRPVP